MSAVRPPGSLPFLSAIALQLACQSSPDETLKLTARDSTAIDSVRVEYARAWLADDTAGVLATLDSAAVVLPPGRLPVSGQQAIRAYWWPTDGSRTTITRLDWNLEDLAGTPRLAFSRGMSTVGWRYQKDTVRSQQTSRSPNLTIFTRGADGRWRILQQMWGPPLP